MEREDNYLHHFHHQVNHNHQQTFAKTLVDDENNGVVDYMLNNPPPLPLPPPTFPPYQHLNQQQQQQEEMISSSGFCSTGTFSSVNSLDRLSFADVMQFADFGPKLGLTQTSAQNQTVRIDEVDEEDEEDPVYFLKFPVLNDNRLDDENDDGGGDNDQSLVVPRSLKEDHAYGENNNNEGVGGDIGGSSSVQIGFLGQKNPVTGIETSKNKRKRPRSIKTSEEVESQRMTHIAVERNRRKQMNEHLRVLRSLMPGSYVQRGDQASIIGGAIEFVRELEQLLQCLESQKRRRLFGDDSTSTGIIQQQQPPPQPQPSPPLFFPPPSPMPPLLPNNNNDQMKLNVVDLETGIVLQEETAEKKSCLADVEVKLLGFDAVIKILCRRRPGQLIKTIAALEDLQLNILHTNITTIEQTVLYSFNVKIGNESQFSADDIASSVQQVFSFIHANSI